MEFSLIMWLWFCWQIQKLNSSENIWKELDANEICFMEWAQTTLKLQVRKTFSCTIERESAAKFFLALKDMKGGQGLS